MNKANIIKPDKDITIPPKYLRIIERYYSTDIKAKDLAEEEGISVATLNFYCNVYRKQHGSKLKKPRRKKDCNFDCFHCPYPDCIRSVGDPKTTKWEKYALKVGLDRGDPAPLIDDEYTEGR